MLPFLHKKCRQQSKILQQANAWLQGENDELQHKLINLSEQNARLAADRSLLEQQAASLRSDLAERHKLCLTVIAGHICNREAGHAGEHKHLRDGEAIFLGH